MKMYSIYPTVSRKNAVEPSGISERSNAMFSTVKYPGAFTVNSFPTAAAFMTVRLSGSAPERIMPFAEDIPEST